MAEARLVRLAWPTAVCLVTAVAALIPVLVSRTFYMRGDTGAQFAPTWYHFGEMVRGGQWPPTMDPDSWVGGNYAGEALFGVYNPLHALIWVPVSLSPDLLVAVTAVKVVVMVLLALGVYLLACEYGAARWAAAVVATAMPISGFTLFWDAGSWVAGLMAFAYTPWVWWSFRRALRGTMNPFWAFLVGVLAVTQGNPYGTLAVAVVGVGLLVEGLVERNGRGTLRLVVLGACVAAFLPLVYLPLLEAVQLAYRADGPPFYNNGKLRPQLGDLLALSAPTYVPSIRAVTGEMRVPATFLAWFVVPLLPWLRYRALAGRGRAMTGVAVVVAIYFVLALGPSKLWLFRWPLRLVEYLHLGLLVVFAVVLSQGLATDRWARRALGSAGLVAVMGWLAWAQDPRWESAALGGTLMLVVLTAALVVLTRVRRQSTVVLAGLLVAGSCAVLAGQMVVFKENASSRPWYFPSDVSTLEERFGDREGLVLQLADLKALQTPGRQNQLRRSWDHYLAGSMYHVAGVEAVNNYSGMGLERFTQRLCMSYDGLVRGCGYRTVWQPVTEDGPPLVDLMKIDTVVVQPDLVSGDVPPDGWVVASESSVDEPLVLSREDELAWPASRLSQLPDDAQVEEAQSVGPHGEEVQLSSTGAGGTVVFGTLGWPGYQAELDGSPVPVGRNPVGLLTVQLPAGQEGLLEVSYEPPGLRIGLISAAGGLLGALVLGAFGFRSRRAERLRSPGETGHSGA